ncbi:hypothetical protein [Candidatus Nitrosocosmicus sp. R]
MSFGIFKEIERLVEYIPIETDMDGIGKLSSDADIDSQFYFEDLDRIAVRLGILEIGKSTISLRDIIKLLNKFLKDAKVEEFVESPRKYEQLLTSGSGLPLKNLLFEFSLSALAGDKLDAKIYLTHTYHILGLRRSLVLLLSIIVNEIENTKYDADVRELFTLLALMSEPNNVDIHFSIDENGFSKRYSGYLQELQKLTLPKRGTDPIDLHSIRFY